MTYPLPDPGTPAGELYLDACHWAATRHGVCWAHRVARPDPTCEACLGVLTVEQLVEGVQYARRAFRRWIKSNRPSLDQAAPAAFGKSERYGLALLVVAVEETRRNGPRWTH